MHVICRWHSIVAGCEFMLCISTTIGSPLLSLPHNSPSDLPKCHYSHPDKLVTSGDILNILYSDVDKESKQDNRHHHHFWTIGKQDRDMNKIPMKGCCPIISDFEHTFIGRLVWLLCYFADEAQSWQSWSLRLKIIKQVLLSLLIDAQLIWRQKKIHQRLTIVLSEKLQWRWSWSSRRQHDIIAVYLVVWCPSYQ